jgi:D-glycero-alpha-D-manno-heptose 1-phosphate guanylyltransferase
MNAWPPCIVLAGGLGTRLQGAAGDVPKCLAPIGGKSFIELQIGRLVAVGMTDLILALGHRAEDVVQVLRSAGRINELRYLIEPAPLGTGGAIAFAMNHFGLDEVVVVNGDTFLTGNLSGLKPVLNRVGGELLRMAVIQTPDRGRFGGVRIGADRRVEAFLEKEASGRGDINAGAYRLCRDAIAESSKQSFSLERDVLPGLAARGAIFAVEIDGSFVDIGVPEDYFRFRDQHAG